MRAWRQFRLIRFISEHNFIVFKIIVKCLLKSESILNTCLFSLEPFETRIRVR